MTSPLEDTTRCPIAAVCATCAGTDGLAVSLIDSPMGVACLTLCDECAADGHLPPAGVADMSGQVADHCRHLGLTFDEAAELHRTHATPADR